MRCLPVREVNEELPVAEGSKVCPDVFSAMEVFLVIQDDVALYGSSKISQVASMSTYDRYCLIRDILHGLWPMLAT